MTTSVGGSATAALKAGEADGHTEIHMMQAPALVHPTLRHPITGAPLRALGVTKRGQVIWPQMGGDASVGQDGGGTGDGGQQGDGGKPGQTFTQADLDRIVADRLARERTKYAGFDDLKAKAAKLDEIESANKTELERAQAERDAAQVELSALRSQQVRLDAALKAGLQVADAQFITAVDPAEAKTQAEALAERLKPKPTSHDQGTRNAGGSGKPSVSAGAELYQQRHGQRTTSNA